ncbi:MAG: sulfatase-like hydrolase/transferase [Rhodothermaceae bacterium]|nr:sulfatase-like hydrolase/transferase [Rhodothermaceae bacterium]
MADDVGFEAFGSYGSTQYKTPNLDRLAREGVRFAHAYSNPLCTPSRVSIMTGKSNVRNYVDFGALTPGQYTFAHLFEEAGYATAIAGKWQLQGSNKVAGTLPAESGFDTYRLWHTPNTARPRYWTPSIEQDGRLLELSDDAYGPDVFTEYLIQFMEANQDRPFFVYYPMALVHDPFLPTPASTNREEEDIQQNFVDMVGYMDDIVGRIERAVNEMSLAEQTVLIFTSDNGTHRNIVSEFEGQEIRGAKATTIDYGNHVPLIAYAPFTGYQGEVVDDLVDFSDFLPTLADIIGAELPDSIQTDGYSFWPVISGEGASPREWVYTYYYPRPYAERLDHPFRHFEVRFAQDQRYKLYGDGRLFDLSMDIMEGTPLPLEEGSAEVAAARLKLQSALDAFPEHGEMLPDSVHNRK